MKYCDMHCDALNPEGAPQITEENLRRGGCLLQCFAAFVSAREHRFEQAIALADAFDALCARENFNPVRRASDLKADKINALFTVEEGGAFDGDLNKIDALYARGARMMNLTWNFENELGYPNFPDYAGLLAGKADFSAREARGLKPFGFEAAEKMLSLGVMIDVSHASDGAFYDVAGLCKRAKKPFVASHSGAQSVLNCARNLTDEQIKTLADCGGVVGLYFCADFLSPDCSAEGQRAALLAHARAIVNAGGEDCLALGSDFDGIPPNAYLKDPAFVPRFLEDLEGAFGASAAEKFAQKNFLRIFCEVCG